MDSHNAAVNRYHQRKGGDTGVGGGSYRSSGRIFCRPHLKSRQRELLLLVRRGELIYESACVRGAVYIQSQHKHDQHEHQRHSCKPERSIVSQSATWVFDGSRTYRSVCTILLNLDQRLELDKRDRIWMQHEHVYSTFANLWFCIIL